MPLPEGSPLGTNSDGSANSDYCEYCYKDGEFTQDCTLDQMIDICAPHWVAGGGVTEPQARDMLGEILPKLKRWQG